MNQAASLQPRPAREGVRRALDFVAAVRLYVGVRRSLGAHLEGPALDQLLDHLGAEHPRSRKLSVRQLAVAVRVAERLVPLTTTAPNTCLFRAIARFALLSPHGHEPVFVLGVRSGLEGAGHAWVEVEGAPFLEREPPPFVRTFTHPAPSRVASPR